MWLLSKRIFLQIAITLVVFGLVMATIALPHTEVDSMLEIMRVLQFAATALLLFGVLKAHQLHKDKFILVWMVITLICIFVMLYSGLLSLMRGRNFFWILLPWLSAVIVALLLNTIYNHYVALTVGAEETITEVLQTNHLIPDDFEKPLNITIKT